MWTARIVTSAQPPAKATVSRRRLLLGGAALGGGAALAGAAAGAAVATSAATADQPPAGPDDAVGQATVDPHGAHQAGIATPLQSFAAIVALNLTSTTDRAALARLMRLWTDDIERLTAGRPALADPVPELASVPASLTITVGFGPRVFDLDGLAASKPAWLVDLPVFAGDELLPEWTGGDVIVQVCANDPVTVAHAQRVLLNDATAFATLAWVQQGFHRAVGTTPAGTVGRNLMGQVDGIINPVPGSADFDEVVWSDAPAWLSGGSGMVIRRARMELDTWTALDRSAREETIGRTLSDGAPLTGGGPNDAVDLEAVDDRGLLVIPPTAHVRLAAPATPLERIYRRPYNYDAAVPGQAGLIFIAFAADPAAQFLPIQQRLAEADLLNTWITYQGSAIVAVLPGFESGGWLGQSLLEP